MNHPAIIMLAKFVPDLHRVEPRNIGVVVWDNGKVAHRFLGGYQNRIDPPKFVPEESRHAYREWVTFWRTQLGRKTIRKRSGSRVKRESPEFIEVLSSKSKPRFMLVEAAKLFDPLNGNIGAAAEQFFATLVRSVSSEDKHKQAAKDLKKSAAAVIHDAVVTSPKLARHIQHNVKVPVELEGGGWIDPVVNEVIANGKPKALLQRTIVDHPQSVANTGWLFLGMQNSKLRIRPEQCASIVNSNMYDSTNREVIGALNRLRQESIIIDLADHERAVEQFARMAESSIQ
jgi:hypothetical protein